MAPRFPSLPVASPFDRPIARASQMIRDGDISSARLVLEHALSRGSAQAAFLLAQTYDPSMLSQWNTRGLRGDKARARELYSMASDLGMVEVKEWVATLN